MPTSLISGLGLSQGSSRNSSMLRSTSRYSNYPRSYLAFLASLTSIGADVVCPNVGPHLGSIGHRNHVRATDHSCCHATLTKRMSHHLPGKSGTASRGHFASDCSVRPWQVVRVAVEVVEMVSSRTLSTARCSTVRFGSRALPS